MLLPTRLGFPPGACHASVDFQNRFLVTTHRLAASIECLTKAKAGPKGASIRDTEERGAVEDRRGKRCSYDGSWALLRGLDGISKRSADSL